MTTTAPAAPGEPPHQPSRAHPAAAAQARRGPVGARLQRAAEQERAVQEGRQPAQRPRPDPEHLLQARLRLDRPRRPARPVPLDGPLHPARARASTAARPRCSRRRSSTTSSSCCASAATARCSTPTQLRALGSIGTDFARGTADITDRQNIQYHWIEIEDVPEIWERLDGVGLTTLEACGDSPRPFLGSPVAGVAEDEIIDAHPGARGDQAPLHRQPGVLQPPAQVQDLRQRAPQPRRRPEVNDVSFVGTVHPEHGPGFDLWVGGGLSTNPMLAQKLGVWIPLDEVADAWEGVTRSSATTATAGCARAPG